MARGAVQAGEKYGRLTALRVVDNGKPGTWLEWACDCGGKTVARGAAVKHKAPRSCGCSLSDAPRKAAETRRRKYTIERECAFCGGAYRTPKCRDWRDNHCSPGCREAARMEVVFQRMRDCHNCGDPFVPRKGQIERGGGLYCSSACGAAANIGVERTNEAKERIAKGLRRAMAEGRLIHKSGPENPGWKGGIQATLKRRKESGKMLESLRRYRAKNPHKTREWRHSRRGRKVGRLPRGTIPRLYEAQRGKCAICAKSLPSNYHTDHIVPLAKGGAHEPGNIQLLCPPCNVRKSAKDPIDYMQELGRLL